MSRIALIGANSQVGTEVAIYLWLKKVDFCCFVRSEYAAAIFRMCGIPYKVVDYSNKDLLKKNFSEFSTIVDFTYPSGQSSTILNQIKSNISAFIEAAPSGSRFIYMSSIMAYGMPTGSKFISWYYIPRTSYAYIKRKTENYVKALSRKSNVKGYNFRLGQVHGNLQSVSNFLVSTMSSQDLAVSGNPSDLTNTVFISSVAESILRVNRDEIAHGTYTIVSEPQWTLKELYQYYNNRHGFNSQITFKASQLKNWSLISAIKKQVWSMVKRHREMLETYIIFNFSSLAPKVKGKYRTASTGNEIKALNSNSVQPLYNLLGQVPGKTISKIGSEPQQVLQAENEIKDYYSSILSRFRK